MHLDARDVKPHDQVLPSPIRVHGTGHARKKTLEVLDKSISLFRCLVQAVLVERPRRDVPRFDQVLGRSNQDLAASVQHLYRVAGGCVEIVSRRSQPKQNVGVDKEGHKRAQGWSL